MELRDWQVRARDAIIASAEKDFLVEATPGAGKTLLAAIVAKKFLGTIVEAVIIVTPTRNNKRQWSKKCSEVGLNIESRFKSRHCAFPVDMHGIVITYAQLAIYPKLIAELVIQKRILVILDEIHHAGEGEDLTWGDSLRAAFGAAQFRLLLSGTPFRSDNNPIPFVTYERDGRKRISKADFRYGYGAAVKDRVCRPVFFPRYGGTMEWSSRDGDRVEATFNEELETKKMNERLWTALDPLGGWVKGVLIEAHKKLMELRRRDPDAGGLIIARNMKEAKRLARALEKATDGHVPIYVASDENESPDRIEKFKKSSDPWMIAVRMVSEGVDIPRLRVGVYLTDITKELFFRQFIGRFVRWEEQSNERIQTAYVYLPDDKRLRKIAEEMMKEHGHCLEDITNLPPLPPPGSSPEVFPFIPLGSESLFTGITALGENITQEEFNAFHQWQTNNDWAQDIAIEILWKLWKDFKSDKGPMSYKSSGPDIKTKSDRKDDLCKEQHRWANALAKKNGLDHQFVNRELNRLVGIRGVRFEEASEEILEKRKSIILDWLRNGVPQDVSQRNASQRSHSSSSSELHNIW